MASCYFVTGYPGFIAKRLVEQIAEQEPKATIYTLALAKLADEAQAHARTLPGADIRVLSGELSDMHMGLSGEEYSTLTAEVEVVFHLAAVAYLGVPADVARAVNVDGTRNVLELARDCSKLTRLCHFSTCYVSGDRVGVICEDELDRGQTFRNAYEETKFEAEKLVLRAAKHGLPVSIFRPASVIGDSKTGKIDRFDGPYYLAFLLVTSPLAVPLPLPGNGVAPFNVVPVDFVAKAALALSKDLRAVGKTFHLVDPKPQSAGRIYELIAHKVNRRLPKLHISARAAEVMLGLPVLERLTRPQRQAVSYVNHLAMYNCQNTLELLEGTGVRCPPLTSYVDPLIAYMRQYYQRRRDELSDVEDPLVPKPSDEPVTSSVQG